MAARTLINSFSARPSAQQLGFTVGDVSNGMKFAPAPRVALIVLNSDSGSSHIVTLKLPPPPDIADATDRTITVPASSTRIIGPFPGNLYTQPSAADPNDVGFCHIDVDSTLLSVVAVRV